MEGKTTRRSFAKSILTIAAGTFLGVKEVESARILLRSKFVPPDTDKRQRAIGIVKGSNELERAFEPGNDFEPMGEPEPGDWLDQHEEPGQSFDQFVNSRPNQPDQKRTTLYLVPFGEFDAEWSPHVKDLEACASAFFQMPVKTLPAQELDQSQFLSRMWSVPVDRGENSNKATPRELQKRQYLTKDFLRALPKLLPADGFAILGMTMEDLYPSPSWNYVFGQAALRDRAGIYSFARYDPHFWGAERKDEGRTKLLQRSVAVILHETCHMFGMQRCIYYRCLVNGSNSLEESDRGPMHLCPVCLRKLHHSVGFKIIGRYEALLKQYERLGFETESKWLKQRLRFLKS